MIRNYPKKRSNARKQRKGSQGFKDGLNTMAHASTLKDTELSELINGIYSQYGTISKRLGSAVIGQEADDATHIMNMGSVYNIGANSYMLRISDNGKPEYYNFSTDAWVNLTATAPDGYVGTTPEFSGGTPTFNTDSRTWMVQIHSRVYFANEDDDLVWLDEDGWHIYTKLDNPTTKTSVAKTGSGTGNFVHYYRYVWYNEVGNTLASAGGVPGTDADGTGYKKDMPRYLDEDTFLTITVPAAPAGCTKVGIFKGLKAGEETYLDSIEPSITTYIDKGELIPSEIFGVPETNNTGGYHFSLLDTYRGSLVGVTTELGKDTLVWSGFQERYESFGIPDGAGFFPYNPGDGQYINGIKAHVASNEDSLFVFKDRRFGKFQFTEGGSLYDLDLAPGTIQDVNIAVGSLSPLSIHTAGNNLRFWSGDGAATVGNEENYATILRYSVLSLRADEIVQRVNAANLEKVSGVFYKSLSMFGISMDVAGSGNNAILAYDERYHAWSLLTGLYPEVFCKYIHPTTREELLYYGSSKDANVLKMFEGRTDYRTSTGTGTRITLSLTTKQYDMGLPDQLKKYDNLRIVFGALFGNGTTVGITKAGYKGIVNDPRLAIVSNLVLSGFGNDEWGNQEIGIMSEDDVTSEVNLKYIDLKQKDLFWLKLNIQNNGVEDEVEILGVYIYYYESGRPLPFTYKLKTLASS
jgi:hypothetical protein